MSDATQSGAAKEAGVARYLQMERAHYANLVEQSDFSSEAFTTANAAEHVVGSYAQHQAYDYERWLLDGIARPAGALALEYGCGPGRMLLRMAPLFARVDGVDISPEVIEVARRRCAALPAPPRLFVTNGDGLPAEIEGVYDLVYSVICLQHICVYSIRYRIFESLFRALKPGGVLTFQMGYGPGHANMADYEMDYVEAAGTNGAVDTGILHPGEIAADLERIGFDRLAYALTPTGPGDTHAAWIFVRAWRPPSDSAVDRTEPLAWLPRGFEPLRSDDLAVRTTRRIQRIHGVLARRRSLHHRVVKLEQDLAVLKAQHERLASAVMAVEARHRDSSIEEKPHEPTH
jgi:SAM-dependent methyltransferase